MFLQLFQNPLYNIYVWLARIFNIDQDIIQIHYNKNIKLFSKDLVNIALKISQCIRKTKEYDLILKVTISNTKDRFSLITFLNSYLVIGTSKI